MAGQRKAFGFKEAMAGEVASAQPRPLDISGFDAPAPVDREAAAVVTAAAGERGFAARAPAKARQAVTAKPRAKARLRISDVGARRRAKDQEDRVQVNIYAPVSVALRWFEFEQAQGGGAAWKAFEKLLDQAGVPREVGKED